MSANARQQQEEDIERLVKCRLRSEIEARKAVDSTVKRAVQEARELKKELLRQEKEELRAAIQAKTSVSAPGGSGGREASRCWQKRAAGSAGTSKDNAAPEQGSSKTVELKLKQQVQTLTARNTKLEATAQELQQQVAALESEKEQFLAESATDWTDKEREIAALQGEVRKSKLAIDETKHKCQKVLKEKRDEAQRVVQENEHVAVLDRYQRNGEKDL